MKVSVHLTIHGRVQGVGLRAWMAGKAKALGLNGWVRNRTDGTVEAFFHGDREAVRHMVELCHKGPAAAKVERVEEETVRDAGEKGFRQLPTV